MITNCTEYIIKGHSCSHSAIDCGGCCILVLLTAIFVFILILLTNWNVWLYDKRVSCLYIIESDESRSYTGISAAVRSISCDHDLWYSCHSVIVFVHIWKSLNCHWFNNYISFHVFMFSFCVCCVIFVVLLRYMPSCLVHLSGWIAVCCCFVLMTDGAYIECICISVNSLTQIRGLPVVLNFLKCYSCPEIVLKSAIVLKFYSFGQNVLIWTFVMLSQVMTTFMLLTLSVK